MQTLFLICAVVGGTIVVFQFVLTVIGMGGDELGADVEVGEISHASDWLVGVISFKTVVAAIAFFGIGGMALRAAGVESAVGQFAGAVASGTAAMYAVHAVLLGISRLAHDATVRIESAVGQTATVYVPVAGQKRAPGKVTVKLGGRTLTYEALTAGEESLPTGARVVVVGVIGPSTLEVQALNESAVSEESEVT